MKPGPLVTTAPPPTPLTIESWVSLDGVPELTEAWKRLASRIPFTSWPWQSAWWRAYGTGRQLFVLSARLHGRIVGILPGFVERSNPLGGIVRLLGSGEVCSDQLGLLAEPGLETAVGTAIGNYLADKVDPLSSVESTSGSDGQSAVPPWDLLEFEGLAHDGPAMAALLTRLEERGFHCHRSTPLNTWRIELPSNMEEYVGGLSKSSRRKMRSVLKRLASDPLEVAFVETEADFEQIWPAFVQLHQRRRASLGEDGCFSREVMGGFLEEIARESHRAGMLDLACVRLAGRPIASELCFRGATTTFAYQIGVDPDFLDENPGWLVNAASIQRAIQMGQRGFDLCRGDNEYKHRLGAAPQPCESCRIVPPRLRSQLWDAALVTQTMVKGWVKAGLVMTGIR